MTQWKWFLYRRLHSLTGLGLAIFLVEHLFINSQAAMPIEAGSSPYITAVNHLQAIPFITLIEIFLLGLPILLHMILGIVYLRTGVYGIASQDGSVPRLPTFNHYAYIAQRWTAWFLVAGLFLHIAHMRFINRPHEVVKEGKTRYEVTVTPGDSWNVMAKELGLSGKDVNAEGSEKNKEMVVETADFGTGEFLVMRETFRSAGWMAFYTVFVLAASFHAFQGFWTFLLSWGITIAPKAQRIFRYVSIALMCAVTALGCIAIFGTYWMHT